MYNENNLILVESSNIKRISYDQTDRTLYVTFNGSGTYEYLDVEQKIFEDFKSAESKGKFFHRVIRSNGYKYRKLSEEELAASHKQNICVDFDGVIYSFVSGWNAEKPLDMPDKPVPGAFEFLREVSKHYEIIIFSSRARYPGGIGAVLEWLEEHMLKNFGEEETRELLSRISVTSDKVPAIMYIDDRAWRFEGMFPSMEAIKKFEPYRISEDLL